MKGIKRVPAGSVEDRLKSFINWTVYLWKVVTVSKSQQRLNRSTKYRNLEERKKDGERGTNMGERERV